MESKEYIINRLKELHSNFPNLSIKYKFDIYSLMHIVEILPQSEYESNEDYMDCESEITYEFDNKYFPESVMFISEDSLVQIDEPEYTIAQVLLKYNKDMFQLKFNEVTYNYITDNINCHNSNQFNLAA